MNGNHTKLTLVGPVDFCGPSLAHLLGFSSEGDVGNRNDYITMDVYAACFDFDQVIEKCAEV